MRDETRVMRDKPPCWRVCQHVVIGLIDDTIATCVSPGMWSIGFSQCFPPSDVIGRIHCVVGV
jgi:hypothetical protein